MKIYNKKTFWFGVFAVGISVFAEFFTSLYYEAKN